MARVRGIFAGISGRLGDKVFRNLRGKTYVARMPEKYTLPIDELSVNRRRKFALCMKMAHSVNKLPLLNYIWKKEKSKHEMPGRIFSHMYKKVAGDNVLPVNLLPHQNFIAKIKSFIFQMNKITVSFEPLNEITDIWTAGEPQISLNGILTFINPDEEVKLRYRCFPISSQLIPTELNKVLTFELHIPNEAVEALMLFKIIYLHCVLVTSDRGTVPQKVSGTFFIPIREELNPNTSNTALQPSS